MVIQAHKAERRKSKLRLAMTGPSGSGKTYSSLLVGRGLVGPAGKILLIDTERGSGELYAHLTDYDVVTLDPPYKTETYIEAIHYAEDNGYDVVILDSISHAWAGQGGLLEQVDSIAAGRGGNKFTAWGTITPKHQLFLDTMLSSKIHVIATIRSKTEYKLIQDGNGKSKPERQGLAPIQRDNVEYEFTIIFDISINHMAEASKDRSGIFNGEIFYPSEETGRMLAQWLNEGIDTPAPKPHISPEPAKVGYQPPRVAAPEKQMPKNIYDVNQVQSIHETYEKNGWNTGVFTEAKINDFIYDADIIAEDFKKRNSSGKTHPTDMKSQSVVSKCPHCKSNTSMTDEEVEQYSRMVDGNYKFDKALCKSCAAAEWENFKRNGQPAPDMHGVELEFVCEKCGAKVSKVQRDVSNLYLGETRCSDCMNGRK